MTQDRTTVARIGSPFPILQRPIHTTDPIPFSNQVGDPALNEDEIHTEKVALESLEQFKSYGCVASIISFCCLPISTYFLPLTAAIIFCVAKIFNYISTSEEKLQELKQKVRKAFLDAIEYPKELALPFFQAHGRLCESLEFPEWVIPGIEISIFVEKLKPHLQSVGAKGCLEKFVQDHPTGLLPISEEPFSNLLNEINDVDHAIQRFEAHFRDPQHQNFHAGIKATIEDLQKDLIDQFEKALNIPQKHNILSMTYLGELIKCCPNADTERLYSEGFDRHAQHAITQIVNGVDWQADFFQFLTAPTED